MVKAQRFVYTSRFVGEPKETDFTLETEELAPIKDGGKFGILYAAARVIIMTILVIFCCGLWRRGFGQGGVLERRPIHARLHDSVPVGRHDDWRSGGKVSVSPICFYLLFLSL